MKNLRTKVMVVCLSILLGIGSPAQISVNIGQTTVQAAKYVYITRTGSCTIRTNVETDIIIK